MITPPSAGLNNISSNLAYNNNLAIQNFTHNENISQEEKIATVAEEFEGIFIRSLLNDALKPITKGIINEEGTQNDINRHFMVDALATSLSKNRALGISTILQAQLLEQSQSSLKKIQ